MANEIAYAPDGVATLKNPQLLAGLQKGPDGERQVVLRFRPGEMQRPLTVDAQFGIDEGDVQQKLYAGKRYRVTHVNEREIQAVEITA